MPADGLALFLQAVVLAVAIVTVLLSPGYLRANGLERGEYYALLLFSVVGMLGLVSSRELVSMFVALEIMSVALYGMAGLDRARSESQESALKYFVTGAFASAFFLYGVALAYGVSGSTSLERVTRALSVSSPDRLPLAVLGAAFLLVGFGFKIASMPFHMWAPDGYEGAPTTVTAFMSAGVTIVGELLRKVAIARFSRTLGTLITSGVPILDALEICAKTAGNKVVEHLVIHVKKEVSTGKTLAEPLSKSNVFPPMPVQMISVGESTGALDQMLAKVADFDDDEVDNTFANLTSMLAPILIVFLGTTVGFIVVSLYLPIFKIGGVVTGSN